MCITLQHRNAAYPLLILSYIWNEFENMVIETGNLFKIAASEKGLKITNREGIFYFLSYRFIGKETNIADNHISYQLLLLKHSGLFSVDELYEIASQIHEFCPESKIDWKATFLLIATPQERQQHLKYMAYLSPVKLFNLVKSGGSVHAEVSKKLKQHHLFN
ncbi:MAG: hypothetical protein JWN76_2581 [Chitinophagaceae bacterium]|nr:hypothetical protein [Chitinophagaceae bacterium]